MSAPKEFHCFSLTYPQWKKLSTGDVISSNEKQYRYTGGYYHDHVEGLVDAIFEEVLDDE